MIYGIVAILSFIPAYTLWPTMVVTLMPLFYITHAKAERAPVETTTNRHAALHVDWSKQEKRTTGSGNSTYTGLGSDPINWRGNEVGCGSFFEATEENMEASKFGQAYVNWLNYVGENATFWEDQSYELGVFLKHVMGWYDPVSCGIGDGGCKGLPSCDTVYSRVQHQEHARQIWFVIRSGDNINRISHSVHEQTTKAQINVQAMAESIAHTFAWKYDESIPAKCEMYSGMVQTLITSIMLAFLTAAPMMQAVVGPAGQAAEKSLIDNGVNSAAKIASAGRKAMRAEASSVAAKAPWTAGKMLKSGATRLRQGWAHFGEKATTKTQLTANAFLPIPNMASGGSLTNAICKHFPNPDKASEANWRMQLEESIKDAGMEYRKEIQTGLSEVNLYNKTAGWLNLNGTESFNDKTGSADNVTGRFTSILAESMYSGSYVYMTEVEQRAYINEPTILERAITAHFQNAVISLLLKNNMCYIHCTPTENKDNEHPPCIEEKAYRFEPEAGVICQPQCWQNWASHHRNLEMFGMDELMTKENRWDVSGKDFLNSSYHHWKKTRYGRDAGSMFPKVEDILLGEGGNTSTGAAIPVAFSPQPIKDLTKKRRHVVTTIPCVVGNDLANETQQFFDAINIRTWAGLDNFRGLALTCIKSFQYDHVNPIHTFLALCRVGWRWPNRGNDSLGIPEDEDYQLSNGSDPLCQPFLDEAQKKVDTGMDFRHVTCAMSNTNISWTIYKQQRMTVYPPHKSHHPNYWSYQKAAWWQYERQNCPNKVKSIPGCPIGYETDFSVKCYYMDKLWHFNRSPALRHCPRPKKEDEPPPGTVSPRSGNSFRKKLSTAVWKFYNGN